MIALRIVSGFELSADGVALRIPMAVQRLVVFLSLHERPLLRTYVAGNLWPEVTDRQAAANLRSALWRLRRDGHRVVEAEGQTLTLAPAVDVDLRTLTALAHRVCRGEDVALDPGGFDHDVLPDWYDDWLVIERERYHQFRLHALEAMSERLTEAGDLASALRAALAAVAGEPLRESAHRALARVHLAEGNRAEAVRQLDLYRTILRDQLGMDPSDQIVELVYVAPTND